MKKKKVYINLAISIIALVVFGLSLAVYFGLIQKSDENNLIEISTAFNIYFVALSLFYITKIFFKVGKTLCYPNSFLFMPISRFGFFLKEYVSFYLNIPIVVLSISVFSFIAIINIIEFDLILLLRLFILYIIQFHYLHWNLLLLKNILKENVGNLVSVIILIHLFTTAAMALKLPIFLLNPLTGWLMLPEIYHFNHLGYILFLVLVSSAFSLLWRFTKITVKWNL